MPTTPQTESECAFCEIVAHEEDAREVFRTDTVVAFFPTEPATLGHTLLIPRVHVRDIWDLDEGLAVELGRWTVRLAAAVKRAMEPDGLNVIQSNGTAATQTVMHLHIHVVPRWVDDDIGRIWPPETGYSEDEKNAAWDSLRQELQSGGQPNSSQTSIPIPRRINGP